MKSVLNDFFFSEIFVFRSPYEYEREISNSLFSVTENTFKNVARRAQVWISSSHRQADFRLHLILTKYVFYEKSVGLFSYLKQFLVVL